MKKTLGQLAPRFAPEVNLVPLDGSEQPAPPAEVQLLPSGRVHSKKGEFLVDGESKKLILAAFAAQENDMVIDYEHQTLGGTEAPAAGWIKGLIDKGEGGIWAKVEWTPRAAEYITNREYRYLSPVVFRRQEDGRIIGIHSAALTNTPAIDGMEPVVNKAGAWPLEGEVDRMEWLERFASILSLPVSATWDDVITTVTALRDRDKTQAVANKEVLGLLELPEGAQPEQVRGKILALKNPSGYVRVEEFQALKDEVAKRDAAGLVEAAMAAGKVAPAQKAWADQYALKDPAGFKAFVEQAPVVVPLKALGGAPASGSVASDETQSAVMRQLGVSADDVKKFGGEA